MMTGYRKKLIEVALPLEAINQESAREKSIRHGHPSTLHLWWARRPLAACRAVLFASLVDDPDYDPAYRRLDGTVDTEAAGLKRAELFNLIEELVKWENSNNPAVLNKARAEIARCIASRKIELGELEKETLVFGPQEGRKHPHGPISGKGLTAWEVVMMTAPPAVVDHFLARYAPPVLDPFAGGGSIPLEAQRLGLRAYASDLNPVAVLINKALIEIPPKFAGLPPVNPQYQSKSKAEQQLRQWHGAQGLAEDVRCWGQWMRDQAEKRIGHLYPKVKITAEMAQDRPDLKPYVGQELTVIAWLWARTVASPNPACHGAPVPLVRSFWLSTKKGKEAYVEPIVDRQNNTYRFEVRVGTPENKAFVDAGTKIGRGCQFKCILSDQPISDTHTKAEGLAGRMGACLMAIVAEGKSGRVYLSPTLAQENTAKIDKPDNISEIEAPIALDKRAIWCLLYGLDSFDKLFTPRQLTALTTFSDLVMEAREQILAAARKAGILPEDERGLADGGTGPVAYADAVATYLAFTLNKLADLGNALNRWEPNAQCPRQLFARQAIPMVWDFAEGNPFSESSGSWAVLLRNLEHALNAPLFSFIRQIFGSAKQLDATAAINSVSNPVISTDPPYYDNIGYADLSDFFYIWLRRSIGQVYPQLFATVLTPKAQELIASPYRHEGSREKAKAFFEEGLGRAFARMRQVQHPDIPLTVYYAFKQAETEEEEDEDGNNAVASTGWETMLSGLIQAGFSIHGTWPMRTECVSRMVGQGTNALASSVVLVCRPRSADAPLATRREFIAALKRELPGALCALQRGSIAPVDLAQAAIGPGMAVFTRYAKVVEADGSAMSVRTALGLINQVLDEVLAEQEGEFDADTRWAIAWFEQFGMGEGPYGVAETLSKAKNTSVKGLEEAGILSARGGKVRLLGRDELPADWDPTSDRRLTIWEAVQHLIRALDREGEQAAAQILRKLGGLGETIRDLAYRLYRLCEHKKWAQEASAYNMLAVAWPELSRLARSESVITASESQKKDLFE